MPKNIDITWSQLASEPPSAETRLRTRDLDVVTVSGPITAAVDIDGHRHLLIPLAHNQRHRTGIDGANLRVGEIALEDSDRYQRFADIQCVNRRLDDLFSELCSDVLDAIGDSTGAPLAATNQVLADWRALFAPPEKRLSDAEIAGLFGELLTLRDLLRHSPSAFIAWRGPTGHRHDFAAGRRAIEVKTSLLKDDRSVRIHGLGQLEPPDNGELHMRFVRLAGDPGAQSLAELVADVLADSDDRQSVIALLAQAGYSVGNDSEHADRRFAVVEDHYFHVDHRFPRLVSDDLHEDARGSVHDVDYSIDLPTPEHAADANVDTILAELVAEVLS
ncbi:PD-(D/E)XK motif protein [Gordonia sp. NPDC003424]